MRRLAPSIPDRYHDLDALRAFAMLLGIALHGLLSFVPLPIWPAQDVHQHPVFFGLLQHALHGFRMPLFFLLSGFFTAMLWRRRGIGGLLRQRTKRIVLPLTICVPLIWPAMMAIGTWGEAKKEVIKNQRSILADAAPDGGDATRIQGDLDRRDEVGVTQLSWAALRGDAERAAELIESGADLEARNDDGSTPLHAAAFLGRVEVAQLLIDQGAPLNTRDHQGHTPLDSARSEWWIVAWLSSELEIDIEEAEVKSGRRNVISLLESKGGKGSGSGRLFGWREKGQADGKANPLVEGLLLVFTLGAFIPVFHHLWFLYYLLWLVSGFVLLAAIIRRMGCRLPSGLVTSPWRAIWWVAAAWVAQLFMVQTFGADTATGIVPWLPKLAYYAVFFGGGALLFTRGGLSSVGRRWGSSLLLAIPALGLGLYCFERKAKADESWILWHGGASLLAVLYAWLMIMGLIGVFRRSFPAENRAIRYLSDSTYFLYLAHLPLIIGFQIWVSDWNLPASIKFALVCFVPTALLLGIYQWGVRYTFVGAVLNGRKTRSGRTEVG